MGAAGHVIAGYDGSLPAAAAVDAAARLLPGARASVAYLWTPPFADEPLRRRLRRRGAALGDFVEAVEREGARQAAWIAGTGVTLARAAGWDAAPLAHRCLGGQGVELAELAARHRPDLIVVGARGLAGARAVLGSVSDVVLHYAGLPVLVVPYPLFAAEHAALATGAALVGWDGSAGAAEALRTARRLFPDRPLLPATVADGEPPVAPPERLDVVTAPAHHRRGDTGRGVAAALSRLARRHGAALIVVGSRGRSAVREILLGSTSVATVHRGDHPVLVVPHPR